MSAELVEKRDGVATEHIAVSLYGWLRSWRYFFCFLGLGLLVAFFYTEENWRGQRAWESYKHEIEARGARLDPSFFVPPPVFDSQNFAMTPLLAPLFEFIPGTQRWRDTNAFERVRGFAPRFDAAPASLKDHDKTRSNSWVMPSTDLAAWHAAFLKSTNRTIEASRETVATNFTFPQSAAAILAALSECDAVLDELRQASQRPSSRFNIRYAEDNPAGILLPHLAVLKHFCQVLQLRASAELALHRTEEAFNDINLIFYLIDATRNEPILISQLVRMAEFHLALQPLSEGLSQWSEPQLLALQDRLSRFDFCADVKHALEAERSLFGIGLIDYFRRSREKSDLLAQIGDVNLPGPLVAAAPNGWFYLEQLNNCRSFEQYLLPAIDLAHHQVPPSATRQAAARVAGLTNHSAAALFFRHEFFCSLLLPAIGNLTQKAAFAQTAADIAPIACALERYHRVHGKFPESLPVLTPEFIPSLPHDIINGQPLKYRCPADGSYLLYSIGWNETDDGGVIARSKSSEAISPAEGDWVWFGQKSQNPNPKLQMSNGPD